MQNPLNPRKLFLPNSWTFCVLHWNNLTLWAPILSLMHLSPKWANIGMNYKARYALAVCRIDTGHFFHTSKKVAFMTLILSKFQSLNANLWSIYSKIFEFMVYTFICAFWKIIFFWLLRPSKSSGALKKDSTFGFLIFGYALKN